MKFLLFVNLPIMNRLNWRPINIGISYHEEVFNSWSNFAIKSSLYLWNCQLRRLLIVTTLILTRDVSTKTNVPECHSGGVKGHSSEGEESGQQNVRIDQQERRQICSNKTEPGSSLLFSLATKSSNLLRVNIVFFLK